MLALLTIKKIIFYNGFKEFFMTVFNHFLNCYCEKVKIFLDGSQTVIEGPISKLILSRIIIKIIFFLKKWIF